MLRSMLRPRIDRRAAAPLIYAALLCAPTRATAQELTEVDDFGANPGALRMYKFLPTAIQAPAPLVVVLHGCSQGAADIDDESGWVEVAQRLGLALLLPEQRISNNSSLCFNWFEPGDITRDQGEAASIAQMVDRMSQDHAIDATRRFVFGVSSGGAMTAALLAAYPERFAGGASIAGIPVGCAFGLFEAFGCINPGVDREPSAWGDYVRLASDHEGPWPRLSVWHGDDDRDVALVNATELVEQWTDVHGADAIADETVQVGAHQRERFHDADGEVVVERYSLTDTGHGVPVDPGPGEAQCGQAGTYFLDVDLCGAQLIAGFWGLERPAVLDAGAADHASSDLGDVDTGTPDAARQVDAAQHVDAPAVDVGAALDAGAALDVSAADTGTAAPEGGGETESGCSCGTAGRDGRWRQALAGLALALLLRRRRKEVFYGR